MAVAMTTRSLPWIYTLLCGFPPSVCLSPPSTIREKGEFPRAKIAITPPPRTPIFIVHRRVCMQVEPAVLIRAGQHVCSFYPHSIVPSFAAAAASKPNVPSRTAMEEERKFAPEQSCPSSSPLLLLLLFITSEPSHDLMADCRRRRRKHHRSCRIHLPRRPAGPVSLSLSTGDRSGSGCTTEH